MRSLPRGETDIQAARFVPWVYASPQNLVTLTLEPSTSLPLNLWSRGAFIACIPSEIAVRVCKRGDLATKATCSGRLHRVLIAAWNGHLRHVPCTGAFYEI